MFPPTYTKATPLDEAQGFHNLLVTPRSKIGRSFSACKFLGLEIWSPITEKYIGSFYSGLMDGFDL